MTRLLLPADEHLLSLKPLNSSVLHGGTYCCVGYSTELQATITEENQQTLKT